ncbi:hypothetical protein H7H37_22810, partial [Mycolicibacterium insubricum]|nr:hypothetical protein [Mycolicibacterium insubricum]
MTSTRCARTPASGTPPTRPTHADRRADNAECDAEDAIEFAIYALEEAEYYVLAAAEARVEALAAFSLASTSALRAATFALSLASVAAAESSSDFACALSLAS